MAVLSGAGRISGKAVDLDALLRRLEGLLVERQELIVRLERMLRGEGADDLRSRLASLVRE